MDPFSPRLLQIDNGQAAALRPVPFQGRVDELTLEKWIVEDPDLVGEPLLVLGYELAEFEEDKDRLDVLALDRSGEIVLVELKVSEDFRVTDLQALAYAGAYARRSSKDLARTLQRHLQKRANAEAQATAPATPATAAPATPAGAEPAITVPAAEASDASVLAAAPAAPTITFDEAAAKIVAFLQFEDFANWQPSQHVRIKLVAPSFPRRVLQTVKWLGDVYAVRLEAITVRLFETAPQKYSIAFERLLPLPAEADFDMTIRERENRKRAENASRRPAVLTLLVNEGKLHHDQKLWAVKTILPAEQRDKYDVDSPVFQVRVHAPGGGAPKLAWRSTAEDPEEILAPSLIGQRIYCAVIDGWNKDFSTAVAPYFAVAPDGKSLEDIALDEGLWKSTDSGNPQ